MPANIITINGVSEFYVVDSKMPDFLNCPVRTAIKAMVAIK